MNITAFLEKYMHNILFSSLIFISLYLNFLYFYHQITGPFYLVPGPISSTVANCLIFMLPLLIIKKRYSLSFIYLFLIDGLLISNILYYKFYKNVIPVLSYFDIGNLDGMFISIFTQLTLGDLFYLLNTLILFLLYIFYFKPRLIPLDGKTRIYSSIIILTTALAVFFSGILFFKYRNKTLEERLETKDINQPSFVVYFGIVPFWITQIGTYLLIDKVPITQEEKEQIDKFLANHQTQARTDLPTFPAKNLILLLVESLDTWVIKFNDGEATPFLKELTKTEDVIYIPNVLPQVKFGRSSDAQLLINTGLFPIFNHTVVNLYSEQYYPSLAEALQPDYFSMTIMGNQASFWNQYSMNKAYNMDTLLSKAHFIEDEIIGMGIFDKSIFRQTIPVLKNISEKKIYTQIVTLSSHNGSDFTYKESKINFPDNFPDEVIDYVKSIEYVDEAIKSFLEDLKKSGLYENSIIIITGDHDSSEARKVVNFAPDLLSPIENEYTTFIPLYIINSGMEYIQQPDEVMGQIDIYPTLLDLMQVKDYFWRGLGNSIFSEQPPYFAVDEFLHTRGDTREDYKKAEKYKEAWTISDLIIRKKYFDSIRQEQ
ncbi:MAG: LTA synthase family protein [Candidatus Azobacteroides sp.]|nr:LTA synthase family protein [Candidatus Azobacteroides sp.]